MAKKLTACFGLGSDHQSTSPPNQQRQVDFFEEENYELALRRQDEGKEVFSSSFMVFNLFSLSSGYVIVTDLMQQMEDHREMFHMQAKMNTRSANTWKRALDEQSKITSYGTTKNALYRFVESTESAVPVWENASTQVQKVIRECAEKRDKIYQRKKHTHGFEHRETKRIRTLFKNAREPVDNANANLQKLLRQRFDANHTLVDAQQKYDEIKSNCSATELKKQEAKFNLARKQSKINALDEQIKEAEEDLTEAKLRYREEATKIFEECDQLEKERLDLIQQTLLKFLDAIHPSEYFHQLSEISDQVKYDIQTRQNTEKDLQKWQREYVGSRSESV